MLCLLFLVAVLSSVADCRTPPGGTCQSRCFTYVEGAICQCDEACTSNMDCCPDFVTSCPKPDCGNLTCLRGVCEVDPKTHKPKCKCPEGFGDLQCSSIKCTPLGRVCNKDAKCFSGTCVCFDSNGSGLFDCAGSAQLICDVKLDPHARSFGGAVANVYWPCRYRLARLTTKLLDPPAGKPGFCSIEVLAFNQISPKSGKHFVSGVEIAVSISNGYYGAPSVKATIAKFDLFGDGVAGNVQSGVRYNTMGTGSHPSVNNVTIDCVYEPGQNFAVLSIPRCQNFKLKFRPYNRHEDPGAQSLAPGVSVRLDNTPPGHHAPHVPSSPPSEYPNTLCGSKDDGSSVYKVPGLTKAEKVLLDLLHQPHVDQTSTLVHNYDFHITDVVDYPEECAVAKETITKCYNEDERRSTIKTCIGLLSFRRYTRCMGPLAMITFRHCLEAFCNYIVVDRCAKIAILASSKGCTARLPFTVRAACSI